MADSSSSPTPLNRFNLRLATETFAEIDAACAARSGHVSRNTWLTEAVEEKLAREAVRLPKFEARRHG